MKNQNSKEHSLFECCCAQVKESLIDLYINVKVRDDTSLVDMSTNRLENEREELEKLRNLDLIEYIKSSVEVLVSLKADAEGERTANGNFLHQKSLSSIRNCHDLLKSRDQFSQSNSKLFIEGESSIISPEGKHNDTFSKYPPQHYEEIMQKLEGDIRDHIRIE